MSHVTEDQTEQDPESAPVSPDQDTATRDSRDAPTPAPSKRPSRIRDAALVVVLAAAFSVLLSATASSLFRRTASATVTA